MTATLPPPEAPAPPGPPGPPRPPSPRRGRRPRRDTGLPPGHLLGTELSLGLLTCAAVAGFGRIFADWSFLAPLLVVAVAAHVTVAACRRRGLGVAATFAVSTVEWFLVVSWLFFVDTTLALVPTLDTYRTARLELDRSWSTFHTIVAPAPVQTGFLLAAAAAVAGGAFLADWAAFRLWSAREALVPSITLFVFATLLADDRYRVASAVMMVAAAVVFVLLHRVAELERSDGWVTGGRARAGRSLVAAGVGLAVIALAVGSIIAPRLPGVDEPPLVDWRNQSGTDNTRLISSPLVDIRSRLVDTSNSELFTVQADAPAYWRIAALDQFDGTQWRLSASTDQLAAGALDGGRGLDRDGARNDQLFTIQQLQSRWVPAASQAVAFRAADDFMVRYDRETSTLISEDPTGEGTTYEVLSVISDHTPAELRSASQDVSDQQTATELPDGFSPLAERLAREATSGAATNYDRALRLQDWFRRDGGFTYSTQVNTGQSTSAIDTFLEDRIGYCEQFAGAYAAMARSLGLPARVAVGYTWGEQDPTDPTRFQVLGRNAHAWPEVWLGEYGWVAFEPTPGRGNPAAEDYTGVAPSQESDDAAAPTTTTTAPPEQATTSTTAAASEQAVAAAAEDGTSGGGGLSTVARGLGLVLAAAVVYALAVPGALALRRRRRRAGATTPAARVGVAWAETSEALAAAGLWPRRDETHAEVATRGGTELGGAGPALARLAATADASAFGPGPSEADAVAASGAAAEVDRAVDASLGRLGRLRRRLDPRPLWQGRAARHRAG